MSHTTSNTQAFIENEVYSTLILQNLEDGLIGNEFMRNVTDFDHGTTLNIKTVGEVVIQDVAEDTPIIYNPIETNTIQMRITEQIGDGFYITDDMREDGSQIDSLLAARAHQGTRAIQETIESQFLATANEAQTDGTPETINKHPHRIASTHADGIFQLSQLIKLKLSFDKAKVPAEGRVLIIDSVVEAALNSQMQLSATITPFGESVIRNGLARGMRFVGSLFGFDLIVSNYLPTGKFSDGTTTIEDGVANIAMCVADDQTKPIMFAWRRMPKSETQRNIDLRRDQFTSSCRYGFGVQRLDTIGVIITDATKYAESSTVEV